MEQIWVVESNPDQRRRLVEKIRSYPLYLHEKKREP